MVRYAFDRSITIDAPADVVHALIVDLHQWEEWSPFNDLDPAMTRTYTGPESGVGATCAWRGNRKAGEGSMTVAAATPGQVQVEVTFLKPFRSTSTSTFSLVAVGAATEATWEMSGDSPGLMGLVSRVVPVEKLLGKDVEKGLARLKATAEA